MQLKIQMLETLGFTVLKNGTIKVGRVAIGLNISEIVINSNNMIATTILEHMGTALGYKLAKLLKTLRSCSSSTVHDIVGGDVAKLEFLSNIPKSKLPTRIPLTIVDNGTYGYHFTRTPKYPPLLADDVEILLTMGGLDAVTVNSYIGLSQWDTILSVAKAASNLFKTGFKPETIAVEDIGDISDPETYTKRVQVEVQDTPPWDITPAMPTTKSVPSVPNVNIPKMSNGGNQFQTPADKAKPVVEEKVTLEKAASGIGSLYKSIYK